MRSRMRILGVILFGGGVLVVLIFGLWAALAKPEVAVISLTDTETMAFVEGGTFQVGERKFGVESYWIDRFEVTEADWRQYSEATRTPMPAIPDSERRGGDYPVRYVTLGAARKFAAWHFKRLPNNLEWERACQGPGGQSLPWGDFYVAAANTYEVWEKRGVRGQGVTRVGTFEKGKSEVGTYDMIGNVWEWTESYFDATLHSLPFRSDEMVPFYVDRIQVPGCPVQIEVELGEKHHYLYSPATGTAFVVLRGGSFGRRARGIKAGIERMAHADTSAWDVGFRCVISAKEVALQSRIASLVRDLGWSDPVNERTKVRPAMDGLVAEGRVAIPYLRRGLEHGGKGWLHESLDGRHRSHLGGVVNESLGFSGETVDTVADLAFEAAACRRTSASVRTS